MVGAPRVGRRELVGGALAATVGTLAGCRRVRPGDVEASTAMAAVRHLAEVVGPRPGTTPAYFRAAGWVESRFERLGWQVDRQRFAVPGGFSWTAPVDAGDSVNVIAHRGDVRAGKPWLAIGAHLDTVPESPGAEDNASGIGVLLTVAARHHLAPDPAAGRAHRVRRRGAARARPTTTTTTARGRTSTSSRPGSAGRCAAWWRWTGSASAARS